MSAPQRFTLRLVPINGYIWGASQANPSGFVGKSFYYEISEVPPGNDLGYYGFQAGACGRVVAVIAYDYFQSRWASLFVEDGVVDPNAPTTYENDVAQLKSFLTQVQNYGENPNSWPQPVSTDAIGDLLPYPASIPPIKS